MDSHFATLLRTEMYRVAVERAAVGEIDRQNFPNCWQLLSVERKLAYYS